VLPASRGEALLTRYSAWLLPHPYVPGHEDYEYCAYSVRDKGDRTGEGGHTVPNCGEVWCRHNGKPGSSLDTSTHSTYLGLLNSMVALSQRAQNTRAYTHQDLDLYVRQPQWFEFLPRACNENERRSLCLH
jgi:hypothetical protein